MMFSSLFFVAQLSAQTQEELREKITQAADEACKAHNVPGIAIAVISEREIAWTQGIGFANIAEKQKVTADTVFNVGSVSKCVASWGIIQLVEQGKVDLDSPIEDFVTGWKLPESEFDSKDVTLRRLLSHTAGLSLHGYPGFSTKEEVPTLVESLSGATNGRGDVRIIHKPGSKWQYSGGGYTLAQLMLEEQTEQEFASYMREHVFEPLGMDSSDFGWTDRISEDAATPYDENGDAIECEHFAAFAAAGLQTTVSDLARFGVASLAPDDDALANVLSRTTLAKMQTKVEPGTQGRSSGLGYQFMSLGGVEVMGHTGSNTGWEAGLFLVPETGDGIIMMTNSSNGQRVMRTVFMLWANSLKE